MSRHAPQMAGAARSVKPADHLRQGYGGQAPGQDPPLISLTDVTEIELLILRRMREMTIGDHRALGHGTGFDYVGLREWQAGDRFSTIDWAQSSLTNFSPLMIREFDQPSTASVVIVADRSASTRCGAGGVPIARGVARAVATVGLSAVFFQDLFGLITFESPHEELGAIRPRIGRNQVIHCLEAYQDARGLQPLKAAGSLSMTIGSFMRKTAMIPFVSDFLFEEPGTVIRELAMLTATHDVFVVLVDAAFAFAMPKVSAGWVEVVDVETGRPRMLSRAALRDMARRVTEWQDEVAAQVRDAGLDVVRIGPEGVSSDLALAEFVSERRLRKVA